jgi:hypothetical protein
MDTLRDYLNPHKIYLDIDKSGMVVGVSNLESTTPTVNDYSLVRARKDNGTAPIRENLTTAESAEKCRVGEPGYPAANGQQVKNGTGTEEIASDDLDLQVGTAKPGTETVPNCGTETRQSAECAWCGPEHHLLRFNVSWWVRASTGKRKWMSVTQQNKAHYCPMCGRKLEVEG